MQLLRTSEKLCLGQNVLRPSPVRWGGQGDNEDEGHAWVSEPLCWPVVMLHVVTFWDWWGPPGQCETGWFIGSAGPDGTKKLQEALFTFTHGMLSLTAVHTVVQKLAPLCPQRCYYSLCCASAIWTPFCTPERNKPWAIPPSSSCILTLIYAAVNTLLVQWAGHLVSSVVIRGFTLVCYDPWGRGFRMQMSPQFK